VTDGRETVDITSPIIQVIAGIVGGNAAGKGMKNKKRHGRPVDESGIRAHPCALVLPATRSSE
jgi:hypothetical protein